MTPLEDDSRRFMALAIVQAQEQARRDGYQEDAVAPDPLVGCVVVTREGKIETAFRGEVIRDEHAEITAMTLKGLTAGELVGATVYTTLEPCAHRGRSKSCADCLIAAGVSRVFIGYFDPDARGHGYEKLNAAGVSVMNCHDDLVAEVRHLNRFFIQSRTRSSLSRTWFKEVEAACADEVKILADLVDPPKMRRVGMFPFPDELQTMYQTFWRENQEAGGWVESIAEFKSLGHDGDFIEFEEYDYIQWRTLRRAGRKPRGIYAGAVLVCPDTESIYIHKRSAAVETEGGKFHAFGGGFIVQHKMSEDRTLLDACLRELHEESNARPDFTERRIVIVENLTIGWIDVMFLGATISRENVSALAGSKEGDVVRVPFGEIESHLCDNRDQWVSNGIAHHLIWLRTGALGAPFYFQEKAPRIYRNMLNRLTP